MVTKEAASAVGVTPEAVLNVRGNSHRDVEPDFAVISVEVSERGPNARDASSAAQLIADSLREVLNASDGVRESNLSRLRVDETLDWDQATNRQIPTGWQAQLFGTATVEVGDVNEVIAEIIESGARISTCEWRIERTHPEYRIVRSEAVKDALHAAHDFASALGRDLGDLVSLSDPGLSSSTAGILVHAAKQAEYAGGAESSVEVDQQPVPIDASVEATFRVS